MGDVLSGSANDIPPGFTPVPVGGGFIAANGPLSAFHEGAVFKLGFRVEPRHCNPMGICHGGMLASFCDMLLPLSVHRKSAAVGLRFLPTISLQLDYMAPVPLGAWVEGECDVLTVTRAMVFAQGLVRADGVLAVRCSGVMKIGPKFGDDAG
ncbi:MAG: PaaI family thioesterase [Rubrivivax sp.]|nr:PaaI family thioesterase [Rubrivivax sp.]